MNPECQNHSWRVCGLDSMQLIQFKIYIGQVLIYDKRPNLLPIAVHIYRSSQGVNTVD